MTLTGSGSDIWDASDQFTYAYKTLSGDGTIIARVVSIGTGTNTWAKGGVMIRESLNGNSASAQMEMTANTDGTAGNGAAFQNRATTGLDMSAERRHVERHVRPRWLPRRTGSRSSESATRSAAMSPRMAAPGPSLARQDVVMTDPVCIGICVTSHLAGEQRTFQFDGIKTTGSVTGAWQGAAISSPLYNSPQNLYVALQDSAGKMAVATNATAVNSATWIEVQMPLSSFTGVSMTKVKKLFIGVGDRNSPAADGTGMLFIDDIRVIKPQVQSQTGG